MTPTVIKMRRKKMTENNKKVVLKNRRATIKRSLRTRRRTETRNAVLFELKFYKLDKKKASSQREFFFLLELYVHFNSYSLYKSMTIIYSKFYFK
jgi:hypothetical protein